MTIPHTALRRDLSPSESIALEQVLRDDRVVLIDDMTPHYEAALGRLKVKGLVLLKRFMDKRGRVWDKGYVINHQYDFFISRKPLDIAYRMNKRHPNHPSRYPTLSQEIAKLLVD